MPKLRVGFYSFTGDEGCMIVLLELLSERWQEFSRKLEIVDWRLLKPEAEEPKLDVAVVEGAISSNKEAGKLRKIRASCKRLVCVGSCAAVGAPSNQRNSFAEKEKQEIKPILDRFFLFEKVRAPNEFVKVDDFVQGCPVMEEPFLTVLGKYFKEFGVE